MLVVTRGSNDHITFIHDARPSETMDPLHVDTLTVQRELPKYEIILILTSTSVPRMKPWLHFMWSD